MKTIKIIRIIIGAISILIVPVLFMASCTGAVIGGVVGSDMEEMDKALDFCIVLFGTGFVGLILGKFSVVKILMIISYIGSGIFLLSIYEKYDALLYYIATVFVFGAFYIFDFIYTIYLKKKYKNIIKTEEENILKIEEIE